MSITLAFIIGFIILAGANIAMFIFLNRRKPQELLKQDDTALKLLLEQVNEQSRRMDINFREMTKTVDSKMGESTRTMNDSLRNQFSESAKLIKDVTQGLTKLDETNKQVVSFADQLQSLQDILKNPKQRGILGEY
jgi:DNA recombination protein RmuC